MRDDFIDAADYGTDLDKVELIDLCMQAHYVARRAMDLYTDLLEETKGIHWTPEYDAIESDAYEIRDVLYHQDSYAIIDKRNSEAVRQRYKDSHPNG